MGDNVEVIFKNENQQIICKRVGHENMFMYTYTYVYENSKLTY